MNLIETIKFRYEMLSSSLDEYGRRLFAGIESSLLGHGGITIVNKATGLSRNTIRRGKEDLKNPENKELNHIRKAGGGRKKNRFKSKHQK